MNSFPYKAMTLVLPEGDAVIRPYFEAAARGSFVLPKCSDCGLMRYPPGMAACPWCGSAAFGWQATSGRGYVHSYVVVTHAIQPGFAAEAPYPVVMVELDVQRGVPTPDDVIRIPTNLVTATFQPDVSDRLAINALVDVVFEPFAPGLAIPKWTHVEGSGPGPLWRYPL